MYRSLPALVGNYGALQELGVLLDVQQRGAVRGEQTRHGIFELVPASGLDAGRSAQLGVGGPVRIVQECVPDREAGGDLLFADLAERMVVEQHVLDRDAVLDGSGELGGGIRSEE